MQIKFAATSVLKIYFKWRIMLASGLWSFYSINFQKKANSSHKPTFFLGITTLFLLNLNAVWVDRLRFLRKKTNFSSLRPCYHNLANRKNQILPLEKYFESLSDTIIGTAGTKLLESFTIFQSGRNNMGILCHQGHFLI